MLADQETGSARVVLAICLIVGISLTVGASLTFLVTPMLDDLGLSSEQGAVALAIPSVGSLLVVFVVGRVGDALGHRHVIVAASTTFVAGSIIVAVSSAMALVTLGLLLAGASATAIQISSLGLLQRAFPSGRARISAFTSFGMVFPAVYLVVPVLTGVVVGAAPWRVVPWCWAALGLLIAPLTRRMLPRPSDTSRVGELATPILAGLALAGVVQAIDNGHDEGWTSAITILSAVVAVSAATVAAILVRRLRAPSLDVHLLRQPGVLLLLFGVTIVAMTNVLTYVTLALQYLYGLTVLAAAVALLPAQAASILGAKSLAGALMSRLGSPRAGSLLLAGFALSLFSLVAVQPSTPMAVLIVMASLFSLFGFASITVLNTAVMAQSPPEGAGMLSAFRGAASSLGGALSVVVLGAAIGRAVFAGTDDASTAVSDPAALTSGIRTGGLVGALLVALALGAYLLAQRRLTAASR